MSTGAAWPFALCSLLFVGVAKCRFSLVWQGAAGFQTKQTPNETKQTPNETKQTPNETKQTPNETKQTPNETKSLYEVLVFPLIGDS